MEDKHVSDRSVISISNPTSAKHIRAFNPNKPVDELCIDNGRIFGLELAQELSNWLSIRKIHISVTTTKAALRELFKVSGIEDIYVSHFHKHGSLRGMPTPKTLRKFSCMDMSCDDLSNIADLPGLTTLVAHISRFSDVALKKIVEMEKLTDLEVEASNIDDAMAEIIAASEQISRLDVCATQIGRDGLKKICGMSQLRELDIWALDIQESDLDLLKALPKLEYLSIGGHDEQTVLTAKGVLPRIAQLPSLKRLWLDGISLTKDEIALLEKRYERVQVTFV